MSNMFSRQPSPEHVHEWQGRWYTTEVYRTIFPEETAIGRALKPTAAKGRAEAIAKYVDGSVDAKVAPVREGLRDLLSIVKDLAVTQQGQKHPDAKSALLEESQDLLDNARGKLGMLRQRSGGVGSEEIARLEARIEDLARRVDELRRRKHIIDVERDDDGLITSLLIRPVVER